MDVNERCPEEGCASLHYVFLGPRKRKPGVVLEIVELLLEEGADSTIKDKDGKTPIELARGLGLKDAAERMERGANKGQREETVRGLDVCGWEGGVVDCVDCSYAGAPLHAYTIQWTPIQARAAKAELLGLLEEEDAKASKKQQKKAKKKGKGKGKGEGGKEAGRGIDGAAAGLAAMSLAGSDAEQEKAAAGGRQPPQTGAQPPPLSEEEAFILARAEAEAPDFICPLTRRIIREVALASDCFSYERAAIEAHIRRCQAGADWVWIVPVLPTRDLGRGAWGAGFFSCLTCCPTNPLNHTTIHHIYVYTYSRADPGLAQDRGKDRPHAAAQSRAGEPDRHLAGGAAPGLPRGRRRGYINMELVVERSSVGITEVL